MKDDVSCQTPKKDFVIQNCRYNIDHDWSMRNIICKGCCNWISRDDSKKDLHIVITISLHARDPIRDFCRFGSLSSAEQLAAAQLRTKTYRLRSSHISQEHNWHFGELDRSTVCETIAIAHLGIYNSSSVSSWEKIMQSSGFFFLLFVIIPTFVVTQRPLRGRRQKCVHLAVSWIIDLKCEIPRNPKLFDNF